VDGTETETEAHPVCHGAQQPRNRAYSQYTHFCAEKQMKKTALITGASSGIGLACAELLAAAGYDLILTARRQGRLDEIKQRLSASHAVSVTTLQLDVRDKAQVGEAFEKLEAPDVLINNAGLALGLSHFYAGDTDQWDTMIDTNVKGLLYVSRAMAEKMIARGSGHIVNIGSIAGKEVYENGNVYCASKHAVDALTRGMRIELAGKGVKVTGIHPGAVETEFSIVRFGGDVERRCGGMGRYPSRARKHQRHCNHAQSAARCGCYSP
jgi:NADP-dependent 3-hydroxy acid dehydrogenase YdfG